MLIDQFFTITEKHREGNHLELKAELNPEHDIFNGHFPGDPIVPGVCQIQIVSDILSTEEQATYYLSSSNQIKFISVIKPQETPSFHISYTMEKKDGNIVVTSKFYNEGIIYFKMKGTYSKSIG